MAKLHYTRNYFIFAGITVGWYALSLFSDIARNDAEITGIGKPMFSQFFNLTTFVFTVAVVNAIYYFLYRNTSRKLSLLHIAITILFLVLGGMFLIR